VNLIRPILTVKILIPLGQTAEPVISKCPIQQKDVGYMWWHVQFAKSNSPLLLLGDLTIHDLFAFHVRRLFNEKTNSMLRF